MAMVTCPDCRLTYDDTYRWTYCPHDPFEMRTTAHRGDGETRVCSTVEELNAFMRGDLPGDGL